VHWDFRRIRRVFPSAALPGSSGVYTAYFEESNPRFRSCSDLAFACNLLLKSAATTGCLVSGSPCYHILSRYIYPEI
jgi:hypothetical protein